MTLPPSAERTPGFVPDPDNAVTAPNVEAFHKDGIPWHDAPVPRRLHRCEPQTIGYSGIQRVDRCACGAIRFPGRFSGWADRNSRKRGAA